MAKVISSASANETLTKAIPDTDAIDTDVIEQDFALVIAQDQAKIGGYGYQIISQQSQRIAALKASVLADKDSENLHQMRIATRRLTAAVLLFADAMEMRSAKGKKKSAQKVARALRRLTHSLGGVRDMDVMGQWFSDALQKDKESSRFSKKEKKTMTALLKTIKKRRKKNVSKLENTLKSDRYKKLIGQFQQWTAQPAFTEAAQAPAAEAAAKKIIDPIATLLQHPAWTMASGRVSERGEAHFAPITNLTLEQLNQELEENGELLHNLRKEIKNVRYQAEFFRGLYGITYAAQVREFRKLQKILGSLQDQIVISQFLADELGKKWEKKLPTIAADFQNSRLALWEQWQPYQKKYLKLRGNLPACQRAA